MKKTIALFVCDPKCSVQSTNGVMKALSRHFNFKLFSKNEVEEGFFDNVDMVLFPGGIGDSDSYDTILKKNKDVVVDYVNNGGKYLGICMGAYWAGKDYFNILDEIDVVQYIKQPNTCTRRPHAKNMPTNWYGGHYEDMFFYDGPTFVGHGHYKRIATYDNTGLPMAIRQKNIMLIGCHPESEQFWYDSYSWLRGKYHEGRHHEILLDLVDEFLER
jgi:GMP synthase-like glutamine amidotransferase